MSLILEALRKSEAERQRGRAPELHAAVATPATTSSRTTVPWPWVIAALALAAAAALWWRGHSPAEAPPPPANIPAASAPAPINTTPALPEPERNAAPRFDTRAPSAGTPPAPIEFSVAAPAATAPPVRTAAPAAPAPDATPAIAPTPSTPPATEQPSTEDSSILALALLDRSQRAALPALRISMHVWNAGPAQRFVIIDGQRLGEGGRIGDGVIERIERDSVVLAWRGLRLRLPRP